MKRFISYIDNLAAKFFNRINEVSAVDEITLSWVRMLFGLYCLSFCPMFFWVGQAPQGFFDPPLISIANLFSSFPPPVFFSILDGLILLSVLAIALGIRARISLMAFFVFMLIASSFKYSFGKIDHRILELCFAACLSFTNCGNRFCLIPDKPISQKLHRASLGVLAIFICFGFFTAGYQKTLYWIDFDLSTSGFLKWFYPNYYMNNKTLMLAKYVPSIPILVLEIMDYIAAIFEVTGFFFLLMGRKFWRIWLLIACLFHLFNTLTLNLAFAFHATVFLVFLYPEVLVPRIEKKRSKSIIFGIIFMFFLYKVSRGIFGMPNIIYSATGLRYYHYAVAIWIVAVVIAVKGVMEKKEA